MSVHTHEVDLSQGRFRLGEWLVEPQLNRLSRDTESTQIELKMMDVLVCLAEHAGELVTRRQLIDTVWATEYITDKTLTRAVAELRRTLGDDARNPTYIETIHRKGYRLIAPVEMEEAPAIGLGPRRAARAEDDASPYPGLSAFSEAESEFFFGRESDVRNLWRRTTTRKLLAVIGPSGIGKTSLLRAGLIPEAPTGWGTLVMQPGESIFRSLGRALVPVFRDDERATRELFDIDSVDHAVAMVCRWRGLHERALLVVDQFEELFTLNPAPSQLSFAEVVGRLACDGDVHVLLAMRDDFLVRCHALPPLRPIFEELTVVDRPNRAALRRALEEPAGRFGYAFEDGLVSEMLDQVDTVRSPLPMLAFTAARLWDRRDREQRRITRQAYRDIGGLGGALARHAEVTLGAVGGDLVGVVRELLRNLVTSEGTRAVRSVDELLSVFPAERRSTAAEVLDRLVTARLLTTYEEREASGGSAHRVEVAHESLHDTWPRLVGWRTQDADAARLRDELREAARTWDEHERSDDYLWSGAAYREYQVWRDRYPGGLTDLEDAFAAAMTRFATRRRRRRRSAVAAAFALVIMIAALVGVSRQKAVAEARRAEAGKLVAIATSELDRYPTAALAYTRAGLELSDSPEARRLAVEVLWRGPVARVLPIDRMAGEMGLSEKVLFDRPAFSPDGRWLAVGSTVGHVLLFPLTGGEQRHVPISADPASPWVLGFGPDSGVLVTGGPGQTVRLLSLSDLEEVRRIELGGVSSYAWMRGEAVETSTRTTQDDDRPLIRSWSLEGGGGRVVGRRDWPGPWDLDPQYRWAVHGRGSSLVLRPLDGSGASRERVIGSLDAEVRQVEFVDDDEVVSVDGSGEIRIWSLPDAEVRPLARLPGGGRASTVSGGAGRLAAVDTRGRLVAAFGPNVSVDVWELRDPPDVEPVRLRRPVADQGAFAAFEPGGGWLAVANSYDVALWPLTGPRVRTLRRVDDLKMSVVAFSSDGRWVSNLFGRPGVRLWPLDSEAGTSRVLLAESGCSQISYHPDGRQALVGTVGGSVFLAPLSGGPQRRLETGWEDKVQMTGGLAFNPSGRLAAAAPYDMNPSIRDPGLRVLRVWDLPSGEGRTYSLAHLTDESWWGFAELRFLPDGSLLAAGPGAEGAYRLDLPDEEDGVVTVTPLLEATDTSVDVSSDGRRTLVWADPELLVIDQVTGDSWRIDTHGTDLWVYSIAIDPTGEIIATGDTRGVVRVGPVTGEEPHLLLGGHEGVVWSVDISPDGKWIASVGDDGIRLWPMPDVTIQPLHTLPHDELLAKLDELTNLRAVRDDDSPTGWTIEVGPFPGWETLPTW